MHVRPNGRLYPHPGAPAGDVYLLDFINHSGTRCDITTNLYFHYCDNGLSKTALLEPMIDKYGNRAAVDLYTLGPRVTHKIYDANRLLLKRIIFVHKDNSPLKPVVLD